MIGITGRGEATPTVQADARSSNISCNLMAA